MTDRSLYLNRLLTKHIDGSSYFCATSIILGRNERISHLIYDEHRADVQILEIFNNVNKM